MFMPALNSEVDVGCYVGGLSKFCHKCFTDIQKTLHETFVIYINDLSTGWR